jgi:hypothetical protein
MLHADGSRVHSNGRRIKQHRIVVVMERRDKILIKYAVVYR